MGLTFPDDRRLRRLADALAGRLRLPACGHEKGWALRRTHLRVRRLPRGTAGRSCTPAKLPLTVWFWAAYLVATHSNVQRQQLGIDRSVRSPTSLRQHGRPRRNPLSGLVEIDEASLRIDPPTVWARTQPRRQDAHRRRHRTRGRKHPRPPAAGRNLLLRRRRPRIVETAAIPTPGRLVRLRSVPADRQSMSREDPAQLVLPWSRASSQASQGT